MRPHFYFVCGIVDAEKDDPRFMEEREKELEEQSETGWAWEIRVPAFIEEDGFDVVTGKYKKEPGISERPCLCDLLYRHHEGRNSVVGTVIEEVHYDMAYILMILFEDRFPEDGVIQLPSLGKEENPFRYREHCSGKGKARTDLCIETGTWIEYYDPWHIEQWCRKALYLLHFAGWIGVAREMLRLVVVKEWS